METPTQYHERTLAMIAESLKAQGYTKKELKQYHLDRINGMSEAEAMKKLRPRSAANVA
jgi:hypothetical protein